MARRGEGRGFAYSGFIGGFERLRAVYDVESAGRVDAREGPRAALSISRAMLDQFTPFIMQLPLLIVASLLMPPNHHLLFIILYVYLFTRLFIYLFYLFIYTRICIFICLLITYLQICVLFYVLFHLCI